MKDKSDWPRSFGIRQRILSAQDFVIFKHFRLGTSVHQPELIC
jgi:hypothetical protein